MRLRYRKRLDGDFCPRCFSPIKWVYDGAVWIPCDQEPVLAYPGCGEQAAVLHRELRWDMRLYRDGPLAGREPVEALRPHIFTCEGLKGPHNP